MSLVLDFAADTVSNLFVIFVKSRYNLGFATANLKILETESFVRNAIVKIVKHHCE